MAKHKKIASNATETLSTNVTRELAQDIDIICSEIDRSRSYVIRHLLQRGFNAYKKDGRLKDKESQQQSNPAIKVAK